MPTQQGLYETLALHQLMRKLAKLLSHLEHTIFKAAHREESELTVTVAKLKTYAYVCKLTLGDYKLVFIMTIKTHVIIFLCDG